MYSMILTSLKLWLLRVRQFFLTSFDIHGSWAKTALPTISLGMPMASLSSLV